MTKRSILISSDRSSGGKTTMTLCIMNALGKRGLRVQPYKCGPDYIDTGYHSIITGNKGRNLDRFLQGDDVFYSSLDRSEGDINVVEGVMGFYDGREDMEDSAWDISMKLGIPVILVMTPKGQAQTFCAMVKGLLTYRKNNIRGLIINQVSRKYFELLKGYLDKEVPEIEVLGYMEKMEELKIPSRHLGLIQGMEIENLKERIGAGAEGLSRTCCIDSIVEIAEEYNKVNDEKETQPERQSSADDKERMKALVAKDEAFSFYYEDSLDMLRRYYDVEYFSPMKDSVLPECDFLYLGGGYPEVFKEELSKNISMREQIRKRLEAGLPCYAECGGMMYLTESIEGYDLVGYFKGRAEMRSTLQHFGYCRVLPDEVTGLKGIPLRGHEFHKSVMVTDEATCTTVTKDSSEDSWPGGYFRNSTFAQYAHINLMGNPEFVEYFVRQSEIHHKLRDK